VMSSRVTDYYTHVGSEYTEYYCSLRSHEVAFILFMQSPILGVAQPRMIYS
jgi:hypothetical protein